jgi:hypothetical protein
MSRRHAMRVLVLVGLLLAADGAPAGAESTVLIKNTWLKRHKNRVTTSASCEISRSHKHPNPIGSSGDDGDLHMACRCAAIGLPMVSEIVNAAMFPDAVADAKDAAATLKKRQVAGAWRLWLEHPSQTPQTQGASVPFPANTNPDHSFELHPVTRLGTHDLRSSFVPIPGYKAWPAGTAFPYYEKRVFTVSRKGAFTAIEGTKSKYNYAKFRFTTAGKSKQLSDGWSVLARIDGVPDSVRRMVAPDDTPPAALIAAATKGKRFEAVGIPRINLERLDRVLAENPGVKTPVRGAYEMILVSLRKVN